MFRPAMSVGAAWGTCRSADLQRTLGCLWPHDPLVRFRDRSHAFVDELLQALPVLGLHGVDVALCIGGEVVHGVELAGLAATVTEAGQDLERVPLDDVDLVV